MATTARQEFKIVVEGSQLTDEHATQLSHALNQAAAGVLASIDTHGDIFAAAFRAINGTKGGRWVVLGAEAAQKLGLEVE